MRKLGHIQQREEHWAIVDLKGKTGHTRTIPMPGWVKNVVDQWRLAASCRTLPVGDIIAMTSSE